MESGVLPVRNGGQKICVGASQCPAWLAHVRVVSVIVSQLVVGLRHHHLLCLPLFLKVVSFLHLFLSVYQIFTNDGISMPAGSYL